MILLILATIIIGALVATNGNIINVSDSSHSLSAGTKISGIALIVGMWAIASLSKNKVAKWIIGIGGIVLFLAVQSFSKNKQDNQPQQKLTSGTDLQALVNSEKAAPLA